MKPLHFNDAIFPDQSIINISFITAISREEIWENGFCDAAYNDHNEINLQKEFVAFKILSMGNHTNLVEMDGEESEELENIIAKCTNHFHLPIETMIKIMALAFQKKTGVFRKNDMVYLERTQEIPIDEFLRAGKSLSRFPKIVLDNTIAVHTQVMIRDDDGEYDYADGAVGESVALLIPRELLKDSTYTSDDIEFYKRMAENGNEHAVEILESVLKQENPEEQYRMLVEKDGSSLNEVPKSLKTEELCRLAVENSGSVLAYVPELLEMEMIDPNYPRNCIINIYFVKGISRDDLFSTGQHYGVTANAKEFNEIHVHRKGNKFRLLDIGNNAFCGLNELCRQCAKHFKVTQRYMQKIFVLAGLSSSGSVWHSNDNPVKFWKLDDVYIEDSMAGIDIPLAAFPKAVLKETTAIYTSILAGWDDETERESYSRGIFGIQLIPGHD